MSLPHEGGAPAHPKGPDMGVIQSMMHTMQSAGEGGGAQAQKFVQGIQEALSAAFRESGVLAGIGRGLMEAGGVLSEKQIGLVLESLKAPSLEGAGAVLSGLSGGQHR